MTKIVTETPQDTTFYLDLCNTPSLDLRDSRGLTLNLSIVLMGVTIALLRNKDGNLSRIHRSMKNTHNDLLDALGIDNEKVVSRSHLPVLLKKVNGVVFSRLIFEKFGITLNTTQCAWFGIDGKELRGSILSGNKRGEAIVPIVRHCDKAVLSHCFYNGKKDSERPSVVDLLINTGVASQCITLDALHFIPHTLETIQGASGIYLVGLKNNQAELFDEMTRCVSKTQKFDYEYITKEKGHGREEIRHYKSWNIENEYIDKRWNNANLCTLIEVIRERTESKTGKYTKETSLYMTNQKTKNEADAMELFTAIRGHWASEVYNNMRDTTLAEDKLKTKIKEVSNNLAIFRTLVISILQKIKPKNAAALLDDFADNFKLLIKHLKQIKLL